MMVLITVNDFLKLAFDDGFEFCVYDFQKGENIYESWSGKEMPEEIGDMFLDSWNMAERKMELNICSI